MKFLTLKQKQWLLKKSQKEMLRRKKRNKRTDSRYYVGVQPSKGSGLLASGPPRIAKAPREFSVQNNPKGTIRYFAEIHSLIAKCRPREELFFDFSEVENISADAIMYIIAVLNNDKKINTFGIRCSGNLPATEAARYVMDECGFYQYVKSRRFVNRSTTTDRIKIHRGQEPENKFAKELCEFVWDKSGGTVGRISTKRLFAIIIEMMYNAHQHAYDSKTNPQMYGNWYSYAEDLENAVQIVFFDTGLGIPSTIKKTLLEKTAGMVFDNDSRYIASALRGEHRTQTGDSFRGKGLPEILESVTYGSMHSLQIISGKGMCYVETSGNILERTIEDEFKGTMFIWQISKEGAQC